MTGRNSTNQVKGKSLTSHQTALQSERQSCFPSPPAPSATCTGEKGSTAGIPTGFKPNALPAHPWAQPHTTAWGWLPATCVGCQQPLEHKSCCLMTLHKGCGTEPGSLQLCCSPSTCSAMVTWGNRAENLEPSLEEFYPKTSPRPQNKNQTSMT